jgi:hypothetical protein
MSKLHQAEDLKILARRTPAGQGQHEKSPHFHELNEDAVYYSVVVFVTFLLGHSNMLSHTALIYAAAFS